MNEAEVEAAVDPFRAKAATVGAPPDSEEGRAYLDVLRHMARARLATEALSGNALSDVCDSILVVVKTVCHRAVWTPESCTAAMRMWMASDPPHIVAMYPAGMRESLLADPEAEEEE